MEAETLEFASERYPYGGREGSQRKAFIEGAKWQQEQFRINNETFKCDSCCEEKSIKEKFQIVDENYNEQNGLFECGKCKGV